MIDIPYDEFIDLIADGYSIDDIVRTDENRRKSDDDLLDYADLDHKFQQGLEKIIIQSIKDWSKSDDQMEFNFAAESVINTANPFLD